MKVTDVIFALVAGRVIGFLVGDFLREGGIQITFWETVAIWALLPFFSLFCLWLAFLIGRRFISIFQAAKHLLVGAVATVLDLKLFELLVWLFSFIIPIGWLAAKSISFLISTGLKYWGNKYWAFGQHEKEDIYREVFHFFCITFLGLIIDVGFFYFITRVLGPQFGASEVIWIKLSVIMAALAAAIWNFFGYKLLVFKK